VQHNRPPQFEASGGDASYDTRRSVAQVFGKQRFDVFGQNAAGREFVTVSGFGQERFTPQLLGSVLERIFERQMLERMQRVVMDEDADGTLGW
jgi:hypothetical protein